jgi:hypothetical protein
LAATAYIQSMIKSGLENAESIRTVLTLPWSDLCALPGRAICINLPTEALPSFSNMTLLADAFATGDVVLKIELLWRSSYSGFIAFLKTALCESCLQDWFFGISQESFRMPCYIRSIKKEMLTDSHHTAWIYKLSWL